MVTDKDREIGLKIVTIVKGYIMNQEGDPDIDIPEVIAKARAESAEQALSDLPDDRLVGEITKRCRNGKKRFYSCMLSPLQNVGNDAQVPTERSTCEWKKDNDGIYGTGCDSAWVFDVGTPEDNKAVYCPMCGKVIKEIQG